MMDKPPATENKVEMEKMVTNFFKTMYIVDRTVQPDGVVHLFQQRITETLNNRLCKEFME
jgi:hypothetical protein